ncbi:MAG: glycosyltransferase [Vulcanimicrobiaceae bacterium]
MNVLLWHVHGSWTTSFVQGSHTYYLPVLPDRGPDGRGRALTWNWPETVVELSPQALQDVRIDAVVLQRPHERALVREWLGVEAGIDVPAYYVEHNAPQGRINEMRHPLADAGVRIPVVHVTHFNELFWDCGAQPTYVVEHGVVDPGYRYSGEIGACAVAINEPLRRGRVTGTDLLDVFAAAVPIDLFGMASQTFGGRDVPQGQLHDEIARRRAYLHPFRWTSLGLTLIEAMHLGMPVVALATTETAYAVPPGAGIVSTNVRALVSQLRELLIDPARCVTMGRRAREHALEHYGLGRFLADWDLLLEETACLTSR